MPTTRQQWGYGLPDQAYPLEEAPAPAAEKPRRRIHLRGDVTGGIAAAVLTIPISMGYGLLALSPFGDAYVPYAILAGLYAPIFGCLVALLLRADTTMIYSPRSIVTFLVGAIVLHSLVRSEVPYLQNAPPATLLTLTFLLIFLGGLLQALFGLFRLGTLVKYIPAPVIAGFQNAAAILIFFSQLDALLGFEQHVPAVNVPLHLDLVKWPTLAAGLVACALMLRGARLTKRIPPTMLGLAGGLAVYYLFAALGMGSGLGPVVGEIPFSWPQPRFDDFAAILTSREMWQVAPVLLGGAVSLAIVGSLDSLLCARLVHADTGNRMNGNAELVRLGLGNMVSAGFGGIANGINLGSSFANHRSGARTSLSLLVHSAVIVVAIAAFAPLIAHLPRVVIAGMLTAIALQLFDRWTLQILKNLLTRRFASSRRMFFDLLVILLVTIAALAMNIVLAVAVGTAVTIVFFLFRMSKSVLRRAYRCDTVHSRRTREPRHMEVLGRLGTRIAVLELEGPIFFGTAENLAIYIDTALATGTAYVILDLKRVNDIDSTGAKILLQMHDRVSRAGKYLLLSSIEAQSQIGSFLEDMGVTAALTRSRIFGDTDRAIEWAEDRVLLSELGDVEAGAEFPHAELDVFARMSADELAIIRERLERRSYRKGDVVFEESDEGRELYIIAKGSASVRLRLPGTGRETRLMTFAPGTVFGEIALLDEEARSASVEADDDLVCYVLAHSSFETLTQSHPSIAIKLLANLGRELSGRLRRANRTIYQLAS